MVWAQESYHNSMKYEEELFVLTFTDGSTTWEKVIIRSISRLSWLIHSGCWNISQCQHKQCFLGLIVSPAYAHWLIHNKIKVNSSPQVITGIAKEREKLMDSDQHKFRSVLWFNWDVAAETSSNKPDWLESDWCSPSLNCVRWILVQS